MNNCCDICSKIKDVTTYIFCNKVDNTYINNEIHLCKHCQVSIFKLLSKSIAEYKSIYEEVKGVLNDRKM